MLKTALKVAMTTMSFLIIGAAAGHALASEMPKFDRKIEAAAKEIVARKVGDIRGSVADVWVAEYGVDDTMTGPPGGTSDSAVPLLKPQPIMLLANLQAPRILPERRVRMVTSFIYY